MSADPTTPAPRMDRHELYERAVQSPAMQARFLRALLGHDRAGIVTLGEDFSAAGAIARAFLAQCPDHRAVCVDLDAQALSELLNHYLTAMSEAILEEDGTLDKYQGDAVMAFWNAPHDIDGHERLACYAALQMQAALRPVNERIAVRANEVGRKPVLLSAGIGINTGLCAVGNMGSRQRFAYSALGDAVNLAARLEGQTKFYGVDILVNETTHDKAPGLAMLELDLIQVIGKVRPVRIYALVGDEGYAQDYQFKSWNALHTQMLTRYRARDFDHALKMVAECREASDGTLESYYDMYEKRIKDMKKKKKIPADWQGIYIAESK